MSVVPPNDTEDLEKDAYADPILAAVERVDKDALLEILKIAKVNPPPLVASDDNTTALHIAAGDAKYKECLDLLLQYDKHSILINVDSKTDCGLTALHIACCVGCDENVLALLQKGCDIEMKSFQGVTALHLAALSACPKAVRYLLDKGADSQSRDDEGNIPLHVACKNGPLDSIRYLVEKKLESVNCQNVIGVTPFMVAVQNLDEEIVRYLLENGARTDIYDNSGSIALFSFPSHRSNLLALLLQSTDISSLERSCWSRFEEVMLGGDYNKFSSLTGLALDKGADCLTVLINSQVPRYILQMPDVLFNSDFQVLSPLSRLFHCFNGEKKEVFDEYLHLLLKHKIVIMDEFHRKWKMKTWYSPLRLVHPFSELFNNRSFSSEEREYYFDVLIANGVTTDYCLQCYNDNPRLPFDYHLYFHLYYAPVVEALMTGNVGNVKLCISNSAVLEAFILCRYFVQHYLLNGHYKDRQQIRNMYEYLTSLEPFYCGGMRHEVIGRVPYSGAISEKFSNSTLKQRCRSVIRNQLRGTSAEDDLRNFRRKILELPLPPSLKDFLLYKN